MGGVLARRRVFRTHALRRSVSRRETIARNISLSRSKKIPHLIECSGSFAWEQSTRRELSNILESISEAFFAVDREWRFTYVNRRTEVLWSKSREDLLGKIFWEVFPQAEGSEQYREICQAMEERTSTFFEAISPIVGVWIAGRAYPPADGGLSVYFQAVTERKRVEEDLRESKERFRAIVSHFASKPRPTTTV
jgi:PAS domain S-box-containing protein